MPPFRSLLFALAAVCVAFGPGGCAADPSDAVVGTWVLDLEHSTLPPVPPALQAMAEGATREYTLRFDRDGQFAIKLWRPLEGTWKLESDTVFLIPADGRTGALLGELEFHVLKGEDRLETTMKSPLGKANMQFKRAPFAEP